jgi:hypothetical protein
VQQSPLTQIPPGQGMLSGTIAATQLPKTQVKIWTLIKS